MPTRRANPLHNITKFALTSITAFVIRHVYRCSPQIKATVLSTVSGIIIIAETSFRLIIQVFRHPDLFTNDYGFIRLAMKFNRKHYGMKRRSSGGQAILEYIIIIALVAVAALTVLGLFGDRIRELISGVTGAVGGKTTDVQEGDSENVLKNMDSSGDINF